MIKLVRQKKIMDIVKSGVIETQEQLTAELARAGCAVTQATVSRDIKELGLVKVPGENNTSHYGLPGMVTDHNREARLKRLYLDTVQGIDCSENIIVIKTLPGGAQGLALALDRAEWPGIIGTVAGDDTIMAVVRPAGAVKGLMKRFHELSGG